MRLIRKYSNNQLYDVETSSFISKESITDLIITNTVFKIVNVAGKNVTHTVIKSLLPGLDIPVTKVKNLIRTYA